MNPNPVPALPIPADTTDVRSGPDVHPGILPLLPLLGEWTGVGQGDYPTIEEFHYGQWIRFSHDGRPFLAYESRTWLIGLDGEIIRPAAREVGWWRSSGGDDFEALLAHPTGIVDGALMYAVDMAAQGQDLQPHLSARLERVVPLPPL